MPTRPYTGRPPQTGGLRAGDGIARGRGVRSARGTWISACDVCVIEFAVREYLGRGQSGNVGDAPHNAQVASRSRYSGQRQPRDDGRSGSSERPVTVESNQDTTSAEVIPDARTAALRRTQLAATEPPHATPPNPTSPEREEEGGGFRNGCRRGDAVLEMVHLIPPLVLLMEMLPIPVALNTPKKRSSLDGRLWAPAENWKLSRRCDRHQLCADLRWVGP